MKIRTIIFLIIVIILISIIIWIYLRNKKESYAPRQRDNNDLISSFLSLPQKYGETIVNRKGRMQHHLTRAKLDEILDSFKQHDDRDDEEYDYDHDTYNISRRRRQTDNEYDRSAANSNRGPFGRYISMFGEAIMNKKYSASTTLDDDEDSNNIYSEESVVDNHNGRKPVFSRRSGHQSNNIGHGENRYQSPTIYYNKNTDISSDGETDRNFSDPNTRITSHIPISSAGSKEERCRRILEKIFNVPFRKRRPNWLINPETKSPMELDCYNEELGIALEYNGKQHYYYSEKLHKSREEFEKQKQRDKYKMMLCKEKGITLITVPYNVPSNDLYTYIVEELERLDLIDVDD